MGERHPSDPLAAAGTEHDDTVLSLSMAVVSGKQIIGNTVKLVPIIGF